MRRTRTALALLSAALVGVSLTAVPAVASTDARVTVPGVTVSGHSATFPLRAGRTEAGAPFWYVAIEASSGDAAKQFKVGEVHKLANAAGTAAVQPGRLVSGVLVVSGTVDFAPVHRVVGTAGTGFPPVEFQAGSKADATYSPLVELPNGSVLNAPIVANATGRHDKVNSLDEQRRTVNLELTDGFSRTHAVRYLSTDASDPLAAALEGSTFVSRLNRAPSAGDDSTHSARASLAAFVNGPTGAANPQRQGINSALLGQGDPLNVLAWLPGQGRYSPLWDVHLTAWAPGTAPHRVTRFADVEDLAGAGSVTAPDGSPWKANDIIVNCPIIAVS